MKKYFIQVLGCDKNTVDAQCAEAIFEEEGCIKTPNSCEADFLLLVSCGFILDAKEQSIEKLFDLARNKNINQTLILGGCLPQRYKKELPDSLPEVDYFLGVDDYEKLRLIIRNSDEKMRCMVSSCSKDFVELPRKVHSSYTSFLKIAEGCNNVCSYCAIPFMKGKYRSRNFNSIVEEAEKLAKTGTKELIIIAQDITYYGQDLKEKTSLAKLLYRLCKIDGIEWIRLMYCYEHEITDELIECIKKEPKICHYIDIPIQHSEDRILKDMNRKSTKSSISATISKLRSEIPDIAVRTTVIVGFPGETANDFKELKTFLNNIKFERLGCFAYSKEEGTLAFKMKNQVRKSTKENRVCSIMEMQRSLSNERNLSLTGSIQKVLIDEQTDDGLYLGRTYMDAPDIDNSVIVKSNKILYPGDFVLVKITDGFDYDLFGEVINE